MENQVIWPQIKAQKGHLAQTIRHPQTGNEKLAALAKYQGDKAERFWKIDGKELQVYKAAAHARISWKNRTNF